jgi:cell division protein FtsL
MYQYDKELNIYYEYKPNGDDKDNSTNNTINFFSKTELVIARILVVVALLFPILNVYLIIRYLTIDHIYFVAYLAKLKGMKPVEK